MATIDKEHILAPRDSVAESRPSTVDPRPSNVDSTIDSIADTPITAGEDCGCGPEGDAVVNQELPSKEDLERCGDLPILTSNGQSLRFRGLYTGCSGAERNLIIFVRHFFCGVRHCPKSHDNYH